jgi:ADP-ribose pyrophosphatase YjhB (NUDIX family)
MSRHASVRFCPLCGTPLVSRDDHGTHRPTCPNCGYIHYRNPVPAAGVILIEQGRVLLVKRRYAPRAGAWCLPAGFMEYGETPRQCAVRELAEETGLSCRLDDLFGVYAGFDDPRVRAVLILYRAERTGGRLVPGDDAIAARWFPLDKPPRAIAFAAHRHALAEIAAQLELEAKAEQVAARARRPVRRTALRPARPPRRAPGARSRSRRA